jgi:hypothetical protein
MRKILAVSLGLSVSLFSFVLAFSPTLAGGGGRAVITVTSPGVAGGKAADLYATIYKDNDMKLSVGEKGFLRVKNAQAGQNCITKNETSDGNAKIYGSCSSPTAGEMEVYIHFPDKVEDGYPYKVPIVEKSQEKEAAAQVQAAQPKTANSPCGSGLVSWGWDPVNGKSCDTYHFDAWTANCGNGYKQHIPLDRCTSGNEMENHPEWRKIAEDICANPKCDAPAKTSAKPAISPTPKASSAITPAKTASSSPQVSSVVQAKDTVQYLIYEPPMKEGAANTPELFMRGQVRTGDGRAYFIPVLTFFSENFEYQIINNDQNPWNALKKTYGIGIAQSDTYAELAMEPKVFTQKTKSELIDLLAAEKITLGVTGRALLDKNLLQENSQLLVLIVKDKTPVGAWLPTVYIKGIAAGIQEFLYPVFLNSSKLGRNTIFNLELAAIAVDGYKPKNPAFTYKAYDFQNYDLKVGDETLAGKHLTEVYYPNVDVQQYQTLSINRDYPDSVKIDELPIKPTPQPSPTAEDGGPQSQQKVDNLPQRIIIGVVTTMRSIGEAIDGVIGKVWSGISSIGKKK